MYNVPLLFTYFIHGGGGLVTKLCPTLATPWTIACQGPLSMGFSRQQYWSGLPCLPPGDLLNPGIEPTSLTSPALAGEFFTTSSTWEACYGERERCTHALR